VGQIMFHSMAFVGAWLTILMGFLGIVALVTLYGVLRKASPVIVLAPILEACGLTLVTVWFDGQGGHHGQD
jgi:hypothetical protein